MACANIVLQGKRCLFKTEPPTLDMLTSGWFPTRKGVNMDNFNISLLLIFLILYILKNGSHQNR